MNEHYEFVNIPLPYAYNALEPYIDEKTMHLHHDRHLQTYINNLNNTLKDFPELQYLSLEELLTRSLYYPPQIKTPIVNNAGGVYNHLFYFSIMGNSHMTDREANRPAGLLAGYINDVFGSFEQFKDKFSKAALAVFGSGYAWLIADAVGALSIITTPNQNTPRLQKYRPLMNIDVWEHAYYLKHYNVRADYIEDWFHVVNWDQVNRNLINCLE